MAKNKRKRKYKSRYKVKKYAAAGMYADNTIASAGQGTGVGSTSNIVFSESDPGVLQQRMSLLQGTKDDIIKSNKEMSETIISDEVKSKQEIANVTAEGEKSDAMVSTVAGGLKTGLNKLGLLKKQKGFLGTAKDMIKAYKAQRSVNLAAKGAKGIKAGVQTAKQASQTAKALQLANQAKQTTEIAKGTGDILQVGQTAGTTAQTAGQVGQAAQVAGTAGQTGSALGAAASVAGPQVIAAALNYGGKGIKKMSDDGDETTWTGGEATGDIMSKTGEYAGYGAMIGSVVPGVGNLIGAGVGALAGATVGTIQGINRRGKARRIDSLAKETKKRKVDKYNTDVKQNLLSAMSGARAGEMEQKTYSGYDLGRNVTAKYGGMRYANGGMQMGIPRYGNAA